MKYPRFTLIIYNKAKKVAHTYYTRRMKSIRCRLDLKLKQGFHARIMVRYGIDPKGGYFENEGTYSTKKDVILAWKAFIDPDLINEFSK